MVTEAVRPTGIGECCLKGCPWNQGRGAVITERTSTPLQGTDSNADNKSDRRLASSLYDLRLESRRANRATSLAKGAAIRQLVLLRSRQILLGINCRSALARY